MGMTLKEFGGLKAGDKVLIEATVRGRTIHGRPGNTVAIIQREDDPKTGRPSEPIHIGIHHDFLNRDFSK